MKYVRALLAFLGLTLAVHAAAQTLPFPSWVQGSTAGAISAPVLNGTATYGAAGSVRTSTTTVNILSGDLSLVAVSYYTGAAAAVSSVSDGTNSYTKAIDARGATGTPGVVELWYKANASPVASGATITVNFSASTAGTDIAAARLSGIIAAAPVDKTATDVTVTSTPTVTTAALAQANEIAFGVQGGYNQNIYATASGFTNIAGFNNGSQLLLGFDYKIVAATTAVTYQPTSSGGGGAASMGAAVATFKGF